MQGDIYLARLDPIKTGEVGKIRPVVVLTADIFLPVTPVVFICPLSSRSDPGCADLHLEVGPRENLHKVSFALPEHARSISKARLVMPRLAQLSPKEFQIIIQNIQRLMGVF